MHTFIKTAAKKKIPLKIRYRFKKLICNIRAYNTRRKFSFSNDAPCWLDDRKIYNFYDKYPNAPEYGYDPESLRKRGLERASQIKRLLANKFHDLSNFLELACSDGMVSHALKRSGKNASAIDIVSRDFDWRARDIGVKFYNMDAAHLGFDDRVFDFVFSYAAFEHFNNPGKVLKEAIRVTKKGGYIYLNFGPLYQSPFGLHFYRSLPVPYCHYLFSPEAINDFADKMEIDGPNYGSLNKWSLTDYRELWGRTTQELNRKEYFEYTNVAHLDLIKKYPSCFKSKTDNFDDLIVNEIEVLFYKQ